MKKRALILSLILLSGCSTHLTDLSVISNKNVDLNSVNLDKAPQVKDVTGEDTKVYFLIPFERPQLKEALNDALRKADGDLMVDASVSYKGWWFLVGESSIEIRGTVVKTRESRP